jgi:hypothetical protein
VTAYSHDDTNAKPFVSALDSKILRGYHRAVCGWVWRDLERQHRGRQLEVRAMKRFFVLFSVAAFIGALALACSSNQSSTTEPAAGAGSSGSSATTPESGSTTGTTGDSTGTGGAAGAGADGGM